MFCAKCGAVLADDARQCDQCGAPVRIRPGHDAGVEKKPKKGAKALSAPQKRNLSVQDEVETGAEADTLRDPVFYEEADRDVDIDAIIKIARGEEPDYGKNADTKESFPSSEDDDEPELDMDTYLAGMPLIQKIRRSISMSHHRREEAADQRRMNRQLERALRHFAEEEADQQKAEELRAEAARLREAEKVRRREAERAETARRQKEKERAEAARLQQEKVRAEKAEAARLQQEKVRAEKAEAKRLQQEKARAEKAEAERVDAAHVQEEKTSAVKAAKKSAETVPLQEEKAGAVKAVEKSAEAAAALQEEALSDREVPAAEKVLDQEVKPAAKKAAERRNETAAVTTSSLNYAELTPEERRIEKARRLRKFQENQPDSMDEFLGRYGMTKDAAVRIATLFLIALLSIIYVMGRGSGNSVSDVPVAEDGITGTTAVPGQEEGGTPAGDSGEIQVPTGGGEFGND